MAEAVLAVKSHKSQAGQVHKLRTAMLTSDSVSCSHSSNILRFYITFTMQNYTPVLTGCVKMKKSAKIFAQIIGYRISLKVKTVQGVSIA